MRCCCPAGDRHDNQFLQDSVSNLAMESIQLGPYCDDELLQHSAIMSHQLLV